MDSVTVLTTQKEKIASVAKQVLTTDHGDLQLLKTPTNVEVCIFFDQLFCASLTSVCKLFAVTPTADPSPISCTKCEVS